MDIHMNACAPTKRREREREDITACRAKNKASLHTITSFNSSSFLPLTNIENTTQSHPGNVLINPNPQLCKWTATKASPLSKLDFSMEHNGPYLLKE
jgi:hypothetical protein